MVLMLAQPVTILQLKTTRLVPRSELPDIFKQNGTNVLKKVRNPVLVLKAMSVNYFGCALNRLIFIFNSWMFCECIKDF